MSSALADAVGTLRIRTPSDDPAIRMACADAVRRARLPKRAWSSRAVLVLRSMSVCAAPGHDPAVLTAELDRRVEHGWRTARPAGPAALGADAVRFRDPTQLVALYLADLASGRVGQRWWWSTISRLLAGAGDPFSVLAAHVDLLPHVFVELSTAGQLGGVVAVLPVAACEGLIRRLAMEFAAPRLATAVAEVRGRAPQPPAGTPPMPLSAAPAVAAPQPVAAAAVDVTAAMRQLLVAVALRLAEDPLDARSSRFAEDSVRRALSPGRVSGLPTSPAADPSDPGSADPAVRAWLRSDRQWLPANAGPGPDIAEPPADRGDSGAELPAAVRSGASRPSLGDIASGEPTDHRHEGLDLTAVADSGSAPLIAADEKSPDRGDARAGPVTELGGVFFLIDPVRQLRLPECFGPDGRLAERLGWWGTVELIARRLLPQDPALVDDPIWTVLAELGGHSALNRARELGPNDVRGTVTWDSDPAPGHILPLDASLARTTRGVVRGWLDDVGPRMAAMLATRLHGDPTDLSTCLLLRRATVIHDRTHLDVHLPLASATAAVRRAGFDRDPGWVPELGRVIAFHFDDHAGGG